MGYIIIHRASDYTFEERKFLMQWINGKEFYSNIKNLYRKGSRHLVLSSMFEKYDSKYDKTILIYRGLSFDKNNKIEMSIFQNIKKMLFLAYEKRELVLVDKSPSSFTHKLNVAKWFAKEKEENYCSVIYYLHSRQHNEIDVCSEELAKKAIYKHEKEVLLATHIMEFEILHISYKNDRIEVMLKEA